MSSFHASYPTAAQIVDECSPDIMPMSTSELIVSSMRNYASAFVVWNLALDPSGGPVQPPNSGCIGCTGVVTVNERTHTVGYGLKYYQIGQFSKFVQRGAVRIDSSAFVRYGVTTSGKYWSMPYPIGAIDDVAFLNPDGSKVLVAVNNAGSPRTFTVRSDRRWFGYRLSAGATVTFTWR